MPQYTIVGLYNNEDSFTDTFEAETGNKAAQKALKEHDLDQVIAVFEGDFQETEWDGRMYWDFDHEEDESDEAFADVEDDLTEVNFVVSTGRFTARGEEH